MLEYLLSTAASKYFSFFAGLVVSLAIIEVRLNVRRLFNENNMKYRAILPVFVAPDWALQNNAAKSQKSFKKFKLFKGLN